MKARHVQAGPTIPRRKPHENLADSGQHDFALTAHQMAFSDLNAVAWDQGLASQIVGEFHDAWVPWRSVV
jgi:hypothetical protein